MPTDYVMRLVEEFVKALARVLFFKEMKQYVNAVDELDNLSRMMTGFTLEQIKSLGIEGVKNFFDLKNYQNIEKIFYSAKALKEEAFILFDQGKVDEGMQSLALSLGIFELIKENGYKKFPGLEEEIKFIRNRIN